MTPQEINERMKSVQADIVHHIHTRDGYRQLYNAACWAGHGEACADLRSKLHAILDQELDSASSVMVLSRKLMDTQK